MAEVVFKVDISPALKDKFESALDKVVNEFIEETEFALADDILSKSELTEKQALKLADELKQRVAKRHGIASWLSKMLLVVEANIVYKALIKRGFVFKLIKLLFKSGFKLYSPQFVSEEIKKGEDKLLKYSKLPKDELEFLINKLFKKIEEVPAYKYSKFLQEALEIFPEHTKDAPYFALALSKDIILWSDEGRHRKQDKVTVLSTPELVELLKYLTFASWTLT